MAVALIPQQAYAGVEFPGFLAPASCPNPCFLGVRPGKTELVTAMQLLSEHSWVEDVQIEYVDSDVRGLRAYGWLSWTWSDLHPEPVDARYPGRMYFVQSPGQTVIETIAIHTTQRTYLAQQALGLPELSVASVNSRNNWTYSMIYNELDDAITIVLTTALDCPATLISYWNSRAEIVLTQYVGVRESVSLHEALRQC